MADNYRPSHKATKERISGVSVKLENPPDARYGRLEENPSGVAEKKRKSIPGESEKDSGFSDTSSEYLSAVEKTELEYHSAPAVMNPAGKSTAAQSSPPSLTPVYLVKNVLVKEPLSIPARSQLVHTRLQSLENQCSLGPAPGQTRVVFIRQPLPPSLKVRKAEAKTGVRKDTYLPILNSYPKIAPHPAKGRHRKDHQEQDKVMDHKSKRLWVDELGGQPLASSSPQNGHTMPVASCQAHWQFQNSKQQLWLGATNVLSQLDSASPSPVLSPDLVSPSECSGSSSPSSSSAPSGPLGAQFPSGEPSSIPSPAKQRRFRNTVEILNRSGLLEITLKTKELIRQNGSTQQQVDELKEHVRMFCNAMRSSDPQDVVRLQEAMKHSGAYRISSPSSPGSAQRRGASDQPPLP